MKPNSISELLDLSLSARRGGMTINVSLTGHAGISKTEQVTAWVAKQRMINPNFGFVMLRCAFLEAPDFLGLPHQEVVEGNKVTTHYTPEFWPRDPNSEGIIFLDEYNRSTTAVMNCLMQLADSSRGVGPNYKLPEGWIIAGATNPESSEYDTNSADTALKDRFAHFEIEYDHNGFVDYMEAKNWCNHIQMFVKSGTWIFKEPSSISKNSKYISPRTFERLNSAHKSGALENKILHRQVCQSILGREIGSEFWEFVHSEAPVTAQEILKNKNEALKKLKEQSNPSNYKGDFISITVESIAKHYGGKDAKKDQIDEDTMVEVATIIPSDLAVELLRSCGTKGNSGNMSTFFKDLAAKHPKLVEVLKANIKVNKAK
jgi:hypothetical protein